jgi:hypothetical protein
MFGLLCGNTLSVAILIVSFWFLGCAHVHLYDVNILVVPNLSFLLDCFVFVMVVMG